MREDCSLAGPSTSFPKVRDDPLPKEDLACRTTETEPILSAAPETKLGGLSIVAALSQEQEHAENRASISAKEAAPLKVNSPKKVGRDQPKDMEECARPTAEQNTYDMHRQHKVAAQPEELGTSSMQDQRLSSPDSMELSREADPQPEETPFASRQAEEPQRKEALQLQSQSLSAEPSTMSSSPIQAHCTQELQQQAKEDKLELGKASDKAWTGMKQEESGCRSVMSALVDAQKLTSEVAAPSEVNCLHSSGSKSGLEPYTQGLDSQCWKIH